MSALFTKEQIFERITDSGYPFWTLWLVSGFQNKSHIMTYWGNDFNEIESDETKINKSIAKLDSVINSCPPDSMFSIEIKNAKTANGIGVIGPLQFSTTAAQTPAQTNTGLNGYTPQPYNEISLEGIKKNIQESFDLKLEHFKNETFLRERENELKRREKELEEQIKECKELKKGYESGVARTADVLMLAGTKIVKMLFPQFIGAEGGAALGNAPQQPTPKAQPQPQPQQRQAKQPEPEPEPDAKSDVVNDVAEFMYNNFTIEQIEDFKNKLKNGIHTDLSGADEYEPDTETDEDEDGE